MTAVVWVGALAGPVCLLAALLHFAWGVARRRQWTKVRGRVTGYSHGTRSSNPDVEFTARTGELIESTVVAIDLGWYRPRDVWVWYDPRNPRRFVTEISPLGKPGVALLLASLPLFLVGALAWSALGWL